MNFFQEGLTSSVCVVLLINKQTNGHENNTSLEEVINKCRYITVLQM